MSSARAIKAMATTLCFGALLAPPTASAQEAVTPTVIILDASESMNEPDAAGQPRFEGVAKALDGYLNDVQGDAPIGLITNAADGEGVAEEGVSKCGHPEIVAKLRDTSTAELQDRVRQIRPGGTMPMGESLTQASDVLPASGKKSIVIVSDGKDTCTQPPPCDVAKQLQSQGTDLNIHTIGYMADDAASAELHCVAEVTGGTFSSSTDAESLREALGRVVNQNTHGNYQFPQQLVQLGKDQHEAPEVPVGTVDQPTRITARTLTEAEEEDGHNMLKLRIPQGHRLQVGYMAVPNDRMQRYVRSAGGFVFSPSLQHEDNGMLTTCGSDNGTGRSNFLDTDAPKSGYLISERYTNDSSCYDSELFLDLRMTRSNEYKDSVDIDMTLAAVPEPEDMGDDFNAQPSAERTAANLQVLSSSEHVVAVTPNTQPEGSEELIGTTYGEIREGETHYYAVPVWWGQSLDGTLEVLEGGPEEDPAAEAETSRSLELQMVNKLGQSQELIGETNIATNGITGPAKFGTLYPISYGNLHSEKSNANSFWLGGEHVVALSYTDIAGRTSNEQQEAPPLKYRLTLKPQGDALDGPVLRTVTTPSSAAEPADNDVTESAAKTAAPLKTTSVNKTLKIVGGSVAAAAVLITAAAVFIKTRKN
ncbi:MAG: VWA domain-containing protein [Corynebacterium sp.]|nr:VWA domain-containing protein [Corynebacterium sp.]